MKNRGISLFVPSLSLIVDWRERDRMNSSGYECDVCVVTLSGLKVKDGGFRLKFVKVCEWFDGCDRLKLYLNQRKTKLPNCTLF